MTTPTERAAEVVLTISAAEADLNRGKLAVTTPLPSHLTERVHGSRTAGSADGTYGISPSRPGTPKPCETT